MFSLIHRLLFNINIGERLAWAFAMLIGLMAIFGAITIYEIHKLARQASDLFDGPFTVTLALEEVEINILKMHREMTDLADSLDPAEMSQHESQVNFYEEEALRHLEILTERFLGNPAHIERLRDTLVALRPIRQEFVDLRLRGELAAANALAHGQGAEHVARFQSQLEGVKTFADGKATEFLSNTERIVRRTYVTMLIVLLGVVLLGALIAVAITRSIRAPLTKLGMAADKVSQGDFHQQVDVQSKDELGRLAQVFNVMVDSIRAQTEEIKQAEEKLQKAYAIIKNQKDRMESELNIGREIQMSMIPLDFPPFPDREEISIFAALEPAREVGGDFYDYYFLDEERFCFCIGDVSGKGVPAALFMAMAKTLIKSRADDDRSTASILTHVNDELSADNENCMFVTVFIGILSVGTGELLYTNAGHTPPCLRRKDGTLQRLDKRDGPAIAAMEGMAYKEERETLEPGDLLFLYTDGVTEAMDIEHHKFSEDRLKDLLASLDTDDVEKTVDQTMAAVRAFEGEAEQADDITVLGIRFQGNPTGALIAE